MAYLTSQSEEDQSKNQLVGGSADTGGSFAGGAANAPSAPGAGTGGQAKFANIQNYLAANHPPSFQDTFQNQIGNELKTQTQGMNSQVANLEGQMSAENQRTNQDPNSLVGNLWNNLSNYQPYAKQINDYLKTSYNAPTAPTAPEKSENFKNYEPYLQSSEAFGNLSGGSIPPVLRNLYKNQSGGALTPGQQALQNQFDIGRGSSFQPAKDQLLQQYQDYQNVSNKMNQDVAASQAAGQNFTNNQNLVRSLLANPPKSVSSSPFDGSKTVPGGIRGPANSGLNVPPAWNQQDMNKINQQKLSAIRAALYGE